MLPKVRSRAGTPTASDFNSADGSPLVQNNVNGRWYGYANGAPYPLGALNVMSFGALGDGSTNDQTAFEAALLAAAGGELVIPEGTYRINTGALIIPDGTVLRFLGKNAKIDYRGTGAALEIRNAKNIAIYDAHIDLTNAGANAIGLRVRGCWWLNIYKPRIKGNAATHTGIQIETSQTGGGDFGSYLVEIHNPDLQGPGLYGIRALRTAGDVVNTTMLNVYGGWSKDFDYGLYYRQVSGFKIIGWVADSGIDAINIDDAGQGQVMPGELGPGSGYGINWGPTCLAMNLIAPNHSGVGGTLGYQNNTSYTPQFWDQGKLRLYASNTDQDYYYELRSVFTYAGSLSERVKGGGSECEIRTFADGIGVKEKFVAGISGTSTAANSLRGQVTFTGAATKAVSFSVNEADASYFVTLGGNVNETFWVTSKGVGGFTVNSSNATSTAVVDWHLIR
jgi:hypothetical protein